MHTSLRRGTGIATQREFSGNARQLLTLPQPGSCIVTAEWNQLPIGGDILDDASLQAAQIVTVRIHEVHAGYKYAVEAALLPSLGAACVFVFPRVQTSQQALEGESGRRLAQIEAF